MKRQRLRKVVGVILSCLIVLGGVIGSFAVEISEDFNIMPLWESISYSDVDIGFSNGVCCPLGTAQKQATATSIEGTLTLYEEIDGEWVYVDEWYKSTSRGTLAVTGEVQAISGVRYKAVFVIVAYTGDDSETHTMEITRICP